VKDRETRLSSLFLGHGDNCLTKLRQNNSKKRRATKSDSKQRPSAAGVARKIPGGTIVAGSVRASAHQSQDLSRFLRQWSQILRGTHSSEVAGTPYAHKRVSRRSFVVVERLGYQLLGPSTNTFMSIWGTSYLTTMRFPKDLAPVP
jgi:hypothetical protein